MIKAIFCENSKNKNSNSINFNTVRDYTVPAERKVKITWIRIFIFTVFFTKYNLNHHKELWNCPSISFKSKSLHRNPDHNSRAHFRGIKTTWRLYSRTDSPVDILSLNGSLSIAIETCVFGSGGQDVLLWCAYELISCHSLPSLLGGWDPCMYPGVN